MPDIIRLLPDTVANQIAAGEVIQRPASVVKELLENAVDSGATSIKLIVKDAGKTLVQVIDNGCGMSETDARMCFERHATSKIQKADDLFAIRTMGFRGEAMASVAAVAQVEMKTKRTDDELGTKLEIESSKITVHEPCSTQSGTAVSVKNLFFNVPARRKFLKSPVVEMRHIIDEFQRVALAFPNIAFYLYHNESEMFVLDKGNFRQRIIGISGKNYNEKLVPVEEATSVLNISGFIGKPESARKLRGEQFFFANNRFIKHAYLHHAVASAYENLIPNDSHPSYFLNLSIDPQKIDINIHPTKTEIKFDDERAIYSIVRAAVRQSLGKYNITPSLDFKQETAFEILPLTKGEPVKTPAITVNHEYNPFKTDPFTEKKTAGGKMDWEKFRTSPTFEKNFDALNPEHDNKQQVGSALNQEAELLSGSHQPSTIAQLHRKYIFAQIKSGVILLHQQRAHERILYEKFLLSLEKNHGASQQLLFPQTIEFSAPDTEILKELNSEVRALGFDISEFGNNAFAVNGIPSETSNMDAKVLLEKMLEYYKNSSGNIPDKKNALAYSLAKIACIKVGTKLEKEEMNALIDELFACCEPDFSPAGKPTFTIVSLEELERKLG